MTHTFRNIHDSREFYLGVIGGLVVAIASVSLEFIKNTSTYFRIVILAIFLVLVLWRWSCLRDVQDDIDIADLKNKRKKQ